MHDLRLVAPALATWAVAAWLVGTGSGTALGVAVLLVVAAAASSRARPAVALTALTAALAAASCAWRLADVESSPLTEAARSRTMATLETTVARDPRTYERFGTVASVVELTVVRASVQGRTVGGRDTVVGFFPGPSDDLAVGQRLVVRGRLAPADDTDAAAVLTVLQRGRPEAAAPWWRGANRLRDGVRAAVVLAPPDPRALVPALVDGDDVAVSDEVKDDFQQAGLTHLLAVSGTNLTIVVGVVMLLLSRTRAGPRLRLLVGLLAVAGFVLLARPDPSVVRAAVMGVVGLVAVGLGSRGGLRVLAVAVVALLVLDPWLARAAGFVLSVCATAGIVLLAPPFADRLRWCPRWIAVAVAVPLAAQVACTPALVALSGEVSVVAVLANLVAGPAVAPTTVAGLLGGLLWLALEPAGAWSGTVAALGARWIVAVGRVAGGLEGAAVGWAGPWWVSLLAVPLSVAALWWMLRRPVVAIGVVLALAVVVWRPPSPGWPPDDWVLVACDVGQGDGLVVDAGDGRVVVIDTGMEPGPIDRCLDRLGAQRVAALVMTHADADHVAGWAGVLRGRQVDAVVTGPSGGPDVPGIPVATAAAGDVIEAGQVRLEVLWPQDRDAALGEDRNDLSLVLRLEVDGVRFLLTGDIEPQAQRALLRSGADVSADVLKVPHHGSAHQDRDFVLATGAEVALLSAGRDNSYGHPAPSTLDLLATVGAAWWRTDLQGDLGVVVRDGRVHVLTRD